MIKNIFFIFFIYLVIWPVSFVTAGHYRSKENPYYWKNKIPYLGYWQQDVHYEIKAFINDSTNVIEGNEYTLTYYNNSPFTLNELFFHLNENAFQPNSYYHNLNINNKNIPKYGKYEAQGLGMTYENIQVDGKAVALVLDNTVLKLILNEPLQSNDSVKVTMSFKTYFDKGTLRRRLKMFETLGTKQFDGTHWYPQVCVYDAKFGWNTDQHMDKEFYNNFGSFDISLTFPQEYIVEATGELVNREEVMPDSLRKKLDLSNFKELKNPKIPTIIIPREKGKYKTWRFYAENVHNFAFVADPLFRIHERKWKDIKVIAMVQEPHAPRWQNSTWFTMQVIKTYSENFGMYLWPKIIIADAEDGMEYPMLTLDRGVYPQHQSLLAHEVGHMWFYGMIGSNETYRASLDEGFTQFLTIWAMDALEGPKRIKIGANNYITKRLDTLVTRFENLYNSYLSTVHLGHDEQLNTHSNGFHGALRQGGSYGLVYYKTGVMLYNLKYVLGDSLFLKAMQHYFNKWKIAHPYPEDFRQSIIEFTQTDLNWFFDQWMETTKTIDYGIKSVSKKDSSDYEIEFIRKGRMTMPIDFTITTSSGKLIQYHIPNTWFVKSTKATVLPKWFGWDLLNPTYKVMVSVNEKITNVQIDPSGYLADIDLRDNSLKGFNEWKLDAKVANTPTWKHRNMTHRPDLWYNDVDGFQPGYRIEGSYLTLDKIDFSIWANTTLLATQKKDTYYPISYTLNYKKASPAFLKKSNLVFHSMQYGGLLKNGFSFEKIDRKQDFSNPRYGKFVVGTQYMYRFQTSDTLGIFYPNKWVADKLNGSASISYERFYERKKLTGRWMTEYRIPALFSQYSNSYLQLSNYSSTSYKKIDFKVKMLARWGWGNTPYESALYLSSASPEDMMNTKLTRATGVVPMEMVQNGIFQSNGGLTLRSPLQYNSANAYLSGFCVNSEIEFDRLFKLKARKKTKNLHFDSYLFFDYAMPLVHDNYSPEIRSFKNYASSGIGIATTWRFSPYNVKPCVIRCEFPFVGLIDDKFTSDPKFILGVNRAF